MRTTRTQHALTHLTVVATITHFAILRALDFSNATVKVNFALARVQKGADGPSRPGRRHVRSLELLLVAFNRHHALLLLLSVLRTLARLLRKELLVPRAPLKIRRPFRLTIAH